MYTGICNSYFFPGSSIVVYFLPKACLFDNFNFACTVDKLFNTGAKYANIHTISMKNKNTLRILSYILLYYRRAFC